MFSDGFESIAMCVFYVKVKIPVTSTLYNRKSEIRLKRTNKKKH